MVFETPVKVTVLLPPENVPPLLVQLPATLMAVAVPAENVPLVSVRSALSVSVVVLPPTLKV